MLEEERAFYDEYLSEWLSRYPATFVLVRGRELVGVFPAHEAALAEGACRFGLTPFLVRQVLEHQVEAQAPALTLGLLHANP